jgi:MFS transporter, DHA1 family, multidrug resistance protein
MSTAAGKPERLGDDKPIIDENIVDFNGPEDPQRPLNWPVGKKVTITICYSLLTMCRTWASTMSV